MNKIFLRNGTALIGAMILSATARPVWAGNYEPTDGATPTSNSVTCPTATTSRDDFERYDTKTATLTYNRTFKWVPDAPGDEPFAVGIESRFVNTGTLTAMAAGVEPRTPAENEADPYGFTSYLAAHAVATFDISGLGVRTLSYRADAIHTDDKTTIINDSSWFVRVFNNYPQSDPNLNGALSVVSSPSTVSITATASLLDFDEFPDAVASASASGVRSQIDVSLIYP